MQNSKFNFATVFSIMVLLVFSYITFLGLLYWKDGDFLLPILLTLALIALVLGCVYVMCLSKATRWQRIGTIGQVFFGIIVLVTLLAAALPFTNFLSVVQNKDDISTKVSSACNAAVKLDEAYEIYAKERLQSYKDNLLLISKGKNINPSRYQECIGGASGNTDEEKIGELEKSLRNKLLPESTKAIIVERHEWLQSAQEPSVWNPLTPSNIRKVDEQVNGWLDNYKKLSSVSYQGEEDVKEFDYEGFSSQLSSLTDSYTKFHSPTFLSVIISLICFFIMMLPYIMTRGNLASATSGKNKKNPNVLYE